MKRKGYSITVVSILLVGLVGLFASNGVPSDPPEQQNFFNSIRQSFIRVGQARQTEDEGKLVAEHWYGTGFLVDDTCTIATAKHVIAPIDKDRLIVRVLLQERIGGGHLHRAKILFEHPEKDIAFIRITPADAKPCQACYYQPLKLIDSFDDLRHFESESAIIAGFPRLANEALDVPIVRRGAIASASVGLDEKPMILLDLFAVKGFSGSPVIVEKTGEVIGIVFGPGPIKRSKDFTFATPIAQSDYGLAIGRQ